VILRRWVVVLGRLKQDDRAWNVAVGPRKLERKKAEHSEQSTNKSSGGHRAERKGLGGTVERSTRRCHETLG
jgi:hypothetical protein